MWRHARFLGAAMSRYSTRDRIIEIADRFFYERGFERTSFADIAAEVGISRGNFYHHFKSKDEILDAVIDFRLKKTGTILETWEGEAATPLDRLEKFVHILLMNWVKIKDYGCPVGGLCSELAKLNHAAQARANDIFLLFRTWLRKQFVQLGHKRDADSLALHLLARSQGVAILANTFKDEKFVRSEVRRMCDWLKTLSQQ